MISVNFILSGNKVNMKKTLGLQMLLQGTLKTTNHKSKSKSKSK